MRMNFDQSVADEDYCYLTTTGRRTGQPHTIEIWFALNSTTVYLLAGSGTRADWVRNLRRSSSVTVRIKDTSYDGRARIVEQPDEDSLARDIVTTKYQPRYSGDLSDWRRTALPVAIDMVG